MHKYLDDISLSAPSLAHTHIYDLAVIIIIITRSIISIHACIHSVIPLLYHLFSCLFARTYIHVSEVEAEAIQVSCCMKAAWAFYKKKKNVRFSLGFARFTIPALDGFQRPVCSGLCNWKYRMRKYICTYIRLAENRENKQPYLQYYTIIRNNKFISLNRHFIHYTIIRRLTNLVCNSMRIKGRKWYEQLNTILTGCTAS